MKYWNEISEETTIYGYPLKELVLFAEACKNAEITEENLHTFCTNAYYSYFYAKQAAEKEMFEEFRKCLNHGSDEFIR